MYLPYQLLNTEFRTLVSAPAQCVEALALITIDEERINRSYGVSPSATLRHLNFAPTLNSDCQVTKFYLFW